MNYNNILYKYHNLGLILKIEHLISNLHNLPLQCPNMEVLYYVYMVRTANLCMVQRDFFIKLCDELKKNLPLKNRFLAHLRFLQPEYRNLDGEKMILGCAKRMPPVFKFSTREMNALSMEWKHLKMRISPFHRNGEGSSGPQAIFGTPFTI